MSNGAAVPSAETRRHVLFASAIALSALVFWQPIARLIVYALHHDFCSQVLIVPFISSYLLYVERKRIFNAARYAPSIGIPLIVLGFAIEWIAANRLGRSAANGSLSVLALALVLIWIGAFIACYGGAAAKSAAFPLLFLFLMIPPPGALLARLVYALQEGSTEVSLVLFRAFGIPVFRHGFVIAVPTVSIEVAQECSSIRSSIALLITCLLAGHLFLRKAWKTALLVALAIPLSVVKNGIRITTLTLLSVYVNPGFLHGRLHRDGGFVFFLVAIGLLYPVFRALEKSECRANLAAPATGVELQKGILKTS